MSDKFIYTDLIYQVKAGDEAAFAGVYDLYSEKVYRLAFRFLKDREQSEEIVQETFINLWLSRDKLDATGNLWLYLYVISKRLSLNALRQVYKSADLTARLLNHLQEATNNTEEEVLARDLENYTEKIIEKLPRQQQLIFKLSRIDGLSHKEIAEQLHISPNTVKNHMVEALKTLRTQLSYSELVYFLALAFYINK